MAQLPRPFHFLPSLPPNPPIPRGLLEDLGEDPPPSKAPPISTGKFLKPGCTAADESLLVRGHLTGLAQGFGGFGLLRESKKHMNDAAKAADLLREDDLAIRMRVVAERLGEVQTPEEAQQLADDMAPIIAESWELGKRCGANRPVKPL